MTAKEKISKIVVLKKEADQQCFALSSAYKEAVKSGHTGTAEVIKSDLKGWMIRADTYLEVLQILAPAIADKFYDIRTRIS